MLENTLPPSFLLLPPSTWGKSVGRKLSRQGILSPSSCMWQKGPGNAAGLVRLNQGFLTYGPMLPSLRHYILGCPKKLSAEGPDHSSLFGFGRTHYRRPQVWSNSAHSSACVTILRCKTLASRLQIG